MRDLFWKAVNTVTRPLAGYAPWWVLLQTTGRRTGKPRFTPLANAPFDGQTLCFLSVYGETSAFVMNIRANPTVRVKRRGHSLHGAAEVVDPTPEMIANLGRYARWVLLRIASDPKIVKIAVA